MNYSNLAVSNNVNMSLATLCIADRCCCYRNILSAHLYLQSIIAGWCGTNPAPVLLLQKRIVSYFECITSKHFFYIMPESQLFLGAVAQRLDFVVLQDEIAIWAKQVIGHQIGVV